MNLNINEIESAIELIESHCEVIKTDISSISQHDTVSQFSINEDEPKRELVGLMDLILRRLWEIQDISVKTVDHIKPPEADIEEAKQPGV